MLVVDTVIVINDLQDPEKAAGSAVWIASTILSIILTVILMAAVLHEVRGKEEMSIRAAF